MGTWWFRMLLWGIGDWLLIIDDSLVHMIRNVSSYKVMTDAHERSEERREGKESKSRWSPYH